MLGTSKLLEENLNGCASYQEEVFFIAISTINEANVLLIVVVTFKKNHHIHIHSLNPCTTVAM